MAQWLRSLASFPEDQSLIPSTHMEAKKKKKKVTAVLRDQTPTSGFYKHLVLR